MEYSDGGCLIYGDIYSQSLSGAVYLRIALAQSLRLSIRQASAKEAMQTLYLGPGFEMRYFDIYCVR
ncbi:hypothetical protein GYMLUDRAFT_51080 [Collybiopsis luxurians FD-317 M1]|uniref:Unplaced genomic scaffold GYMLUscaffold_145, whole genome shotgun sequence n=1 Tax=Collybiopsis luxurians FD-317 M1 TaxID=944289 RepID=A0A0D0AK96_9AGAR|nr:hypothetical protein GYMLUDRAFT_51080 [Collybiopsis luxurians FD-317 M1]